MFDCWYDVLFMKCCVGFMPGVMGHTPSKKFNFCLISPQNICPKFLGIIKIFFGKCETSLCVLFGQQWLLPWNSPMDAVLPSLFLIVESWTLTLIEASEPCSSLDVVLLFFYDLLDESLLRSWGNFGRLATPGKVHHCSKFSPFVDNGSDHGSLESQSLRNGFITLSRLIHVNYFVSHLFLNFFRLRHDVLLFKHASLLPLFHQGSSSAGSEPEPSFKPVLCLSTPKAPAPNQQKRFVSSTKTLLG